MPNAATVELVKRFEGFRAKPYLCPAGVWTIGYGSTRRAGRPVKRSDPPVTPEEAEALLLDDLAGFEAAVSRMVRSNLNENQHGALTSFAYNLGAAALRSSTLLKRVNGREWDDVPGEFRKWVYAGGRKLAGLVARRAAEVDLWMKGVPDADL